eukprot:9503201-Pyramimonas_sp.AAC.1
MWDASACRAPCIKETPCRLRSDCAGCADCDDCAGCADCDDCAYCADCADCAGALRSGRVGRWRSGP